jgi:GNAT superfamily N-acetyltransferase
MTAQDDVLQFSVALNISVHRARYEDIEKLEWYGQFTHYRRLFRRSYREQTVGRRLLLVADCNDFPIGRLFMQFHSKNNSIADGMVRGYLYSFYIMELMRGQGIGSRMMDVAESILIQRKYQIATIAVAKDNEGALRLYKQRGYEVFGEDEGKWRYYDHHGQLQQVHEPAWLLEKKLKVR